MTAQEMYVDERGNPLVPAGAPGTPQASYPPTMTGKSDKADLLDKIKPDKIVETIRHKLMGEEFNQATKQWDKVPELESRALTKLGAWDIANLMLGVSSQNVALSKLNDHEIRERTLSIIKTTQHMLLSNWKEYGINSVDQLEFVHQIVMSNTFITLKQPEHGGIRDLIKNTTSENRNVAIQEKQGRFNFLKQNT